MWLLLFAASSASVVEYSPDKGNLFDTSKQPVVGFFYLLTQKKTTREMEMFDQVASLFDGISFVRCNCDEYGPLCKSFFIEPFPSINYFSMHKKEPHDFSNEHNVYAIAEFIQHKSKIVPRIEPASVKTVDASNYVDFSLTGTCNFVTYVLPRDRMSELLKPTLRQIAAVYKDEPDMNFGVVDCANDTKFCQSVGIKEVPTLRVYKNGSYFDYAGTREVHRILPFINAVCGKYRNTNGQLEYKSKKLTARDYRTWLNADSESQERGLKAAIEDGYASLIIDLMVGMKTGTLTADDVVKAKTASKQMLKNDLPVVSRQKVEDTLTILTDFENALKM